MACKLLYSQLLTRKYSTAHFAKDFCRYIVVHGHGSGFPLTRVTVGCNLRLYSTSVSLEANPRVCLHDVPTLLQVTGLKPLQKITIRAQEKLGKTLFCSYAHYTADETGSVKVDRHPSHGGSYTGVFTHGLLSTLTPAPNELKYAKPVKEDTTTPHQIRVTVHDGHESLEEKTSPLSETLLERYLMAPGVKRIPLTSGPVKGTLFLPPGPGPHPGVIDLYGGRGGLTEKRAALTASRGIASLALAYYRYEGLSPTWDRFELEYFEEAVNLLLSRKEVIPDRCGIFSVCFGSTLALFMGIHLKPVKAIASVATHSTSIFSSITYKGKEIISKYPLKQKLMEVNDEYEAAGRMEGIKEVTDISCPGIIPIEQAERDTHFLFVCSGDDAMYRNKATEALHLRLKNAGKADQLTQIEYPEAGLILEHPFYPFLGRSYVPNWIEDLPSPPGYNFQGVVFKWGGNPRANCEAQINMWPKCLSFLSYHIKDRSPWYQNWLEKNRGGQNTYT